MTRKELVDASAPHVHLFGDVVAYRASASGAAFVGRRRAFPLVVIAAAIIEFDMLRLGNRTMRPRTIRFFWSVLPSFGD